jgi:hypothetical protein
MREIVEKPISEIIEHDDREELQDCLETLARNGKIESFEINLKSDIVKVERISIPAPMEENSEKGEYCPNYHTKTQNIKQKPANGLKELQEIWYQKLEDSGFIDIEKSKYLPVPCGTKSIQDYEPVVEHYRLATQLLNKHRFKDATEKMIWALYCDGKSYRQIGLKVGRSHHFVFKRIKLLTALL